MVLQAIRERLTGILAFAILGILVIPFAFVGVNSYFNGGSQNLVARVNDKDITVNDFNQSFSDYRRRMQSVMGDQFDITEFDSPIARREHLDQMIDQMLMAQASDDAGYEVDDETLAKTIRDIPAFQVEGKFNEDVYTARLTAQGLTPKTFEQQMRLQMTQSQLPQAITLSSFTTGLELRNFVAMQNQKRTFRVVIAPDDKQSVPDTFSDEDVKAWYQAHQADYQSPEQVVISYLELNADNVKDIPEPTDQDLRDRFEQQKGRFVAPEKRLVSHILIAVPADADEVTRTTAKQKAEDLAKRARDGEDFAELAEQNSDDFGSKIKGGDLGWIGPGDMVKPFEDAAYKLTMEHPVSDPVQTSFGWHVILLRDIKPAEGLSFEEARPTLVQEYQEEAGEREYLDKADRMVDIVYEDPTTLEPAAAELKLQIKTAGPFSRAGGEGIAANPDVVKAAFSDLVLLQGSVSDPIELGTNHMIMLRDKEHMPAAVKPLEEVRDQVVAALRKDRAHQEALKQANALLTALQSGDTDLKTLAQDAGLEMQTVEGALRTDTSPDAPTVTGVFKLARPQENQPVYAIVEAGNGPAVVALDEVVDGSEDDVSKPELKQDRRQIANASASYDAWGLLKELRDSAEITVYEENLNSAQ